MKRWTGNLIALLIASTLTLAIFEGFLRVFYNPTLVHRQMAEFDPVLGWRLKPGHYRVRRSETLVSHTIDVNRLGMRGPEIALVPSADSTRVVLLGDSFTLGMLTPSQALFSAVAERSLNRGAARGVQMVNVSAQGYGTAQQLLFVQRLEREGSRADLYLVMFYLNDLLDNLRLSYDTLEPQPAVPGFALDARGRLYLEHAPEKRLVQGGSQVERGRGGFRLLLWGFLRNQAADVVGTHPDLLRLAQRLGVRVPVPHLPTTVTGWYDESIRQRGWPLTCALLRELRREVESHGARLGIVVIPSPFQVYPSYQLLVRRTFPDDPQAKAFLADPWQPQRMVEEFCREEGLPCLDLAESFRHALRGPGLYSTKDFHFTRHGHRVVGEAVAGFVRQIEGMLSIPMSAPRRRWKEVGLTDGRTVVQATAPVLDPTTPCRGLFSQARVAQRRWIP